MNNSRFSLYVLTVSIIWGGLLYLSVIPISVSERDNVWVLISLIALLFLMNLADMISESKLEKSNRMKAANEPITLKQSISILTKLGIMLVVGLTILHFDYGDGLLSNELFMSCFHAGIGAIWASKILYAWYFNRMR